MITVNSVAITPTIFPDCTSQVWKLDLPSIINGERLKDTIFVCWKFEYEAELFHLHQLCFLLDELFPNHKRVLEIPYLPYARQDKEVSNDSTFALEPFADILNMQHWDIVLSFDVHNPELTGRLIENFHNFSPQVKFFGYDLVVFPDNGAANRYSSIVDLPFTVGEKHRDPATGFITDYTFNEEKVKPDSKVLVMDDLCDGGATFNILGKSLVKKTKYIDLYVSHGLFSKGVEELSKTYCLIITSDSCINIEHLNNRSLCKESIRMKSMFDLKEQNRLKIFPIQLSPLAIF